MGLEGENCESPRIMHLDNASWLGLTAATNLAGGVGGMAMEVLLLCSGKNCASWDHREAGHMASEA